MKKLFILLIIFMASFTYRNLGISVGATDEDVLQKINFNIFNNDVDELRVVVHFSDLDVEDKFDNDLKKFNRTMVKFLEIDEDVYLSEYTPFIEFHIPFNGSVVDVTKDLKKICKNDLVETVFVENDLNVYEPQVEWGNYEVFEYPVYYNTTSYKGSGIDVGIVDTGFVDSDAPNFDNTNVVYRSYSSSYVEEHATMVAAIAVGTQGIARDADLYSARLQSLNLSYLDPVMSWMDTNGVDVINMSIGSDSNGAYTSADEYLDYFIFTNGIPVVKSAGNDGLETGSYVTTPGLSVNAITVGNLQNSTTLSPSSSHEEADDTNVQKPTLVALGGYWYQDPYGTMCYMVGGTSLAAPAVTGTIAAMMSKRSYLKYVPQTVTAILTANASMENLSSYNDYDYNNGLEDRVGVGELQVNDSINGVFNAGYHTVYSTDTVNTVVYSKTISLDAYDVIDITLWWRVYATYDSVTYTAESYSPINLDLQLNHTYDGLYCQSTNSGYNYEIMSCLVYSTWDYTIDVILKEVYNTSIHGSSQQIGYAYIVH